VSVVALDMATAFGVGAETAWLALLEGRCALAVDARFYPSDAGMCRPVGVVKEGDDAATTDDRHRTSDVGCRQSRFMRLVSLLLPAMRGAVPEDAKLLLATTVGETDLLEMELLVGTARRAVRGGFGETALPY